MGGQDRIFGWPEIDSELAPSLPSGWLGLLLGSSGSGTHLLAKQFANAGVGESPVLYYTTYERTQDVVHAFEEYGWDAAGVKIVNLAEEYFERVLVRDLAISRARVNGLRFAELSSAGPAPIGPQTFNLTNHLLADLAGMQTKFRLVLDSLDFLLELLEPAEVFTVARQIRHCAQNLGGQALLVVQQDVHDRRMTGLLEDMADLAIELSSDMTPPVIEHHIAIRKVRNHPDKTRVFVAGLSDQGFSVVPTSHP